MAESRYGIRLGRPTRAASGTRKVRNVRLDSYVDARVVAFQGQEQFSTYTLALEWLLKRGLRGVEQGAARVPDELLPGGHYAPSVDTVAELRARYGDAY